MFEATIASFVLRFTQERTSEVSPSAGAWRGVIRHVQSSQEIRFVQIEDAIAFIARYVDLSGGDGKEADGKQNVTPDT